MNIFALDQDPAVAAKYHCDKHVVKMPVESAQMMATIIRQTMPKKVVAKHPSLFKSSHPEHPCTVWARTTTSNYEWLKALSLSLIQEHEYRYGLFRQGLRDKIVSWPTPDLPSGGLTPFALAMPEWIREVGLNPVIPASVLLREAASLEFQETTPSTVDTSVCSKRLSATENPIP